MEREFHQWLHTQTQPRNDILVHQGDDACVVSSDLFGPLPAGITFTTDAIADGTHFDLKQHDLQQIGWKAMGVNFSDIAAMGAKPVAALLTVMIPTDFDLEKLKLLYLGCQRLADRFDVPIIGGDTNRWPGPLVVSVTAIGKQPSVNGEIRIWKMDSAKPGDVIVVSGSFGGSLLGKHLNFVPRIELASYLASEYTIHAATDVSDSLSLDLHLLIQASRKKINGSLGAELEADKIPISDAAKTISQSSDQSPLEHALVDGEDFELLLTLEANQWRKIQQDPWLNKNEHLIGRLTSIGKIVAEDGIWLSSGQHKERFIPQGYNH